MRRFVLRAAALLLLLACIGYLIRDSWLPSIGEALIQADLPTHADAVICLAGGYNGTRVVKSAQLVKDGFAPIVLVSGSGLAFGHKESELAIRYAITQGFPESSFRPIHHDANSTHEEAIVFRKLLNDAGMKRVLVVTSNFHTRRAGRIFRSVLNGVDIRMIAAPDPEFDPEHWWQKRSYRKVLFLEWAKTIAAWLGV